MTDQNLDQYLSSYTKFNDWLIAKRYKELHQYFKGDSCLEMGIAEGTGVGDLLEIFKNVTVVDGSKDAIESIKQKFPDTKLRAVNAYFESLDLGEDTFDTIIMAHILEHVDDPIVVLKAAKKYLTPKGRIVIDVPNGNSLHRQIGVSMGLMKNKTDLNEADLSIGHQRVYTPEAFQKDIVEAGLEIEKFGGMFIKVLSNSQTEKVFTEQQLDALFAVGLDNPEIAAEMFIIARLPKVIT